MTTTTEIAVQTLSNLELIEARQLAQGMLGAYQTQVGHLDQEIHSRLNVTEATALTDNDGVILVNRKIGTPSYDQGLLVALKEALSDEAYGESWIEEWTKETVVEAHWDMTKVKKWARTLGKSVQGILDVARLPGAPGKLEFPETV